MKSSRVAARGKHYPSTLTNAPLETLKPNERRIREMKSISTSFLAGGTLAGIRNKAGKRGVRNPSNGRGFNTARCILNLQAQRSVGCDRARRGTRNGRGKKIKKRETHRSPWLLVRFYPRSSVKGTPR